MVKVFYAEIPEHIDESVVPYLSDYRQNRLSLMTNEKSRRESIAAELLLEKAVFPEIQRPLPISVKEFGKPYFSDSDLHFSLSHSGPFVGCAIGSEELGFDVQQQKACDLKLAKRFYSEEEYEYVCSASDSDKAFAEIWSKKESFIKASGLGMRVPLRSFSVLSNSNYWHTILDGVHFSLCVPTMDEIKIDMVKIKLL